MWFKALVLLKIDCVNVSCGLSVGTGLSWTKSTRVGCTSAGFDGWERWW